MTRPKIVFVSSDDAGAARMAVAFLEQIAGERYEARSGGVAPAAGPRPEAVEAMAEEGIVVADVPGRPLPDDLPASAARVVGVGCSLEEVYGPLEGVAVEEWGIPELEGRPLPEVRVIRDTVRRLVTRLVARLDTEAVVR